MLTVYDSPFYRVTGKALIRDSDGNLLLVRNHNGNWEIPGGGWEHDEAFNECLSREVREELGVDVDTIGPVLFIYRGKNIRHGFITLRIAVPVTLQEGPIALGDDMQEYKFVDKEEFLRLDMMSAEGRVQEYADQIWTAVEKTPANL